EEGRHQVAHGLLRRRYMFGAPDVDGTATVPGKVGRCDKARRDARRPQGAVPGAMMLVGDRTGTVTFQHHRNALLDGLKGFVIAAGSHGVATVTVILVAIRIPRTSSHAFDQPRTDTIALNR